jgi:16S rRNA (cytosine967-C5)-methyltransferase
VNDAPRRNDRGAPRPNDRNAPRTNDRNAPRTNDRGAPRTNDRGAARPNDRPYSRTNDRQGRGTNDRGSRQGTERGNRGDRNNRQDRGATRRPDGGGWNRGLTGRDNNRRDDSRGRDRRGPRPTGQAYAENRSRPLYPEARSYQRRGDRRRDSRPGSPTGRGRDNWQGRSHGLPQEEEPAVVLPANPREAALKILHAADTRSAFSDRMLEGAHSRGGDPRDLALMHELVKGTLRWRGRIDWVLDRLLHIGLSQVQPWIKNVLRMGAYQILFLDRVPMHAAVDESVKLAHQYGHPGTAGLVNSVLRRLAEEKDTIVPPDGDDAESLSIWGSHPLWLTELWLERFGPADTRKLLMADNRPAPIGLRVNRLRGTREQLIERLAEEGVTATPARFSPDLVWVEGQQPLVGLRAFKEGWCTAQDESEALVARLVAPQPHERLLDLCAAPGGKCTHLAELMGDEGEVWALERAESRMTSLQTTVDRLGTHAVHVVQGDGRTYTFPMPFDRVLVDSPCSGLGVLARRADARWRKGPEMLDEMPPIQLELLAAGGRRARPGGVLVYSVCSFEPEETTEVVERFLRQQPSFVLESAAGLLPDEVVDEHGFMRLLPHVHGCDGAFAARFRRT